MIKRIEVKLDERVVLMRRSIPIRALGPGRHTVLGFGLTVRRWATEDLVFYAPAEIREVIPDEWYREVSLSTRERAIVYRDGLPVEFLRPGIHRIWTIDQSVEIRVFSVDGAMPEMTDELARLIPRSEYVDATIAEHERGLEFASGRLVRVLEPGRYTTWSYPEARVEIERIDMRMRQLSISGQELMTRDKVTLRLSLSVDYAIADPALAAQKLAEIRDAVYTVAQLAVRDYVAAVTLDELLEGRDAMTRYLESETVPKTMAFGVRIERIGVKDIVLPGEMKALLNRVIEAEKEAAANVILRREETAATRSLANTAKVMAQNPVLLRLKELDAMKEIAERIEEVRVVVGDGGLEKLVQARLLTGDK